MTMKNQVLTHTLQRCDSWLVSALALVAEGGRGEFFSFLFRP